MSYLMVLYLSFATGLYQYQEYEVPTAECRDITQEIRRRVRAGRVWFLCDEVKR